MIPFGFGPRSVKRWSWDEFAALPQTALVVAPPALVNGYDLMRELELGPGPYVGELLESIREAAAAGEVTTREEAVALARRTLAEARG